MKRRMILITNLDVWLLAGNVKSAGTGNQSLYNTLLGYARAGWEVHMMTTSMVLKDIPPIHENVIIHRRPLGWVEMFFTLKKRLYALAARCKPRSVPQAVNAKKMVTTQMTPETWKDNLLSVLFARIMARRAIKLARILGNVEFIYGHEIYGALAGRRAADVLHLPLITRFQGTELSQFLDDREKLFSFAVRVRATRTPADLIIMANDGTRGDEVLNALGVAPEKYRFYLNGVVKEDVYRPQVDIRALRAALDIADDELFLLYTGRMFYWKRLDRHLEVLAKVRERFPRFKLVVIGDGPEMAPVQAMTEEKGLQQHIQFLGAMPHAQVMDYLNACDVYISFHDLTNLCNPAIEACVCGKCIVTTKIGGITGLLTDQVNAVVVDEPANVDKIADALLAVLRDAAFRSRLADGARKRGQSLNTWEERMVMEVQEVEKVLKNNRLARVERIAE